MIETQFLKNSGYVFKQNWFSHHIRGWLNVFTALKLDFNQPITMIEIGSYEGLSASWIAENLLWNQKSLLYCIDTFQGGVEHNQAQKQNLLERFLHNIECTKKRDQIIHFQKDSFSALTDLYSQNVSADIVYVDGSHLAKDVLSDLILSWKLLKPKGLLIADDYLWKNPQLTNNPIGHPKIAIDSFANCFFDEIQIVSMGQQAFFVKK